MPIRYVHNDPGAVPRLESNLQPLSPRSGQLARFAVGLPVEKVYEFRSTEFVDRQCCEAALRSLQTWESVATPLRFWANGQRSIQLIPRHEIGIGARYERTQIGFNLHPVGDPTFFAGASTDAVSHEVGHAILDAQRPELWDSFFAEVAAFHEGFADCISLLVALHDSKVVDTFFGTARQPIDVLNAPNLMSQVAESVAQRIHAVYGSTHAASVPRRLRNTLRWAIPGTLPPNPTPTNLSREPHSFGRVFSGCFYDCINNIFRLDGPHTAAGLQSAAANAGRLLAVAVSSAPEEVRFFRSVGRAMIHADSAIFGGAHHVAIRDAFVAHNVSLGSSAMLAATAGIDGPAPARRGRSAQNLNARTRRDLARRTGSQRARVSTDVLRVGKDRVVRAKITQSVGVRTRGIDVETRASEDILLGSQSGQCVVLGELPNRATTESEINAFVDTLSAEDLDASKRGHSNTHVLRTRGGRSMLRRVRFSCGT